MSVGARVRQLLDSHSHSYLEAAKRTGVSHETIRRIVMGHEPPKLRLYLRKIAAGYGVEELALLEGASPKGEFEWAIRHAPLSQRLEWMLMSPAQRVKLTLTFLGQRYSSAITPKMLAAACGMDPSEVTEILGCWELRMPDRVTCLELSEAVHGLTGISLTWMRSGRIVGREDILPYLARFCCFTTQPAPAGWVLDVRGLVG